MKRKAQDYSDCQPVSFRRPEHLKGGGGWHFGRLLEVKDNGDCVVVDFKGAKHTVADSDVRDVETTAAPTQLTTRRTKRATA